MVQSLALVDKLTLEYLQGIAEQTMIMKHIGHDIRKCDVCLEWYIRSGGYRSSEVNDGDA